MVQCQGVQHQIVGQWYSATLTVYLIINLIK